MLVGGTIVGRFGWRPFFLALGAGSLLWLIPWFSWMPRRRDLAGCAPNPKVRILDILRRRSAWGTCFGQFAVNYCLYFLVTWLPSYLTRGRHFSMDQMARTGGLIFLFFALSALAGGKVADLWSASGASATLVRKTFLGVGMGGLGLCLAASAIAPDPVFIWMLVACGVFIGLTGGQTWAVTQGLAGPHVAGRWAGVQNFIGNLGGACAPLLTGYLVGRTGQFYWPFLITAVVAGMGLLSWVVWVGRIETVDWEKELSPPRLGSVLSTTPQAARS